MVGPVRLPDGTTVNFADWVSDALWSTAIIPAGFVGEISLFNYGVGNTRPGGGIATKADTNVTHPGAMATGEEFLVQSVLGDVWPATADVSSVIWSLDVSLKSFLRYTLHNLYQRAVLRSLNAVARELRTLKLAACAEQIEAFQRLRG